MSIGSHEDATAPRWDADRLATANLMLGEALRRRTEQDSLVADLRRRSVSVLTVISASTLIVAGLVEEQDVWIGFVIVAAAFVALMVFSTIQVQRPRNGFYQGINLDDVASQQYGDAHPEHQVVRDFATYHYEDLGNNTKGPVIRMQRWFQAELLAAGVVVVIVLLGITV